MWARSGGRGGSGKYRITQYTITRDVLSKSFEKRDEKTARSREFEYFSENFLKNQGHSGHFSEPFDLRAQRHSVHQNASHPFISATDDDDDDPEINNAEHDDDENDNDFEKSRFNFRENHFENRDFVENYFEDCFENYFDDDGRDGVDQRGDERGRRRQAHLKNNILYLDEHPDDRDEEEEQWSRSEESVVTDYDDNYYEEDSAAERDYGVLAPA